MWQPCDFTLFNVHPIISGPSLSVQLCRDDINEPKQGNGGVFPGHLSVQLCRSIIIELKRGSGRCFPAMIIDDLIVLHCTSRLLALEHLFGFRFRVEAPVRVLPVARA